MLGAIFLGGWDLGHTTWHKASVNRELALSQGLYLIFLNTLRLWSLVWYRVYLQYRSFLQVVLVIVSCYVRYLGTVLGYRITQYLVQKSGLQFNSRHRYISRLFYILYSQQNYHPIDEQISATFLDLLTDNMIIAVTLRTSSSPQALSHCTASECDIVRRS